MNIPNDTRRQKLLAIYEFLKQKKLDSESGIWLDDLRWDDDEKWHDNPSQEFINLQAGKFKDSKDALIGALSQKNDIVLVTNDRNFKKKCDRFGIKHISPEMLIKTK